MDDYDGHTGLKRQKKISRSSRTSMQFFYFNPELDWLARGKFAMCMAAKTQQQRVA
jgi:hypothetical protein